MTELGERFLLALHEQSYGFVVDVEDVRILRNDRQIHHIPRVLFEEPDLEFLLRLAITAFIRLDGRFGWTWPEGDGLPPGMN